MARQLIAHEQFNPLTNTLLGNNSLQISEFFFDTIQGEGNHIGHPAAFLRLTGCTLNCKFCDTAEVWKTGDYWSIDQLLNMISNSDLISKLENQEQHLVITGGSALIQQINLTSFFDAFHKRFRFVPYVEVENECVLPVYDEFEKYVDCWNNSPKLNNSGVTRFARYKERIIKETAMLSNSWFKFVIASIDDWTEIESDFLQTNLISRDQIILMPEGATKKEIYQKAPFVAALAVKKGVRYSSREHIMLWGNKIGV